MKSSYIVKTIHDHSDILLVDLTSATNTLASLLEMIFTLLTLRSVKTTYNLLYRRYHILYKDEDINSASDDRCEVLSTNDYRDGYYICMPY
ncbi:hypothetical protein E3P89_01190 [Wallemia ichthyophaga]|uniref:Uncharacterized protein n=1 Tax=Wallemia ichthyophaga TaxID=245174 RepID=A0A4T0HFW6_WALIC|nr:hypothetical protein E3P90_01591 [Wallemia ichthyophaga]TIB15316.1 hypothetical protein E3P93_01341 [Wallemia ichthyophaga]TIB24076.1 hypothetical protein E3P89_01190 [Wallemia ichthyophaga]TIB25395.1 hypothetical protein E3P88_01545 [Wallemia ichthyophaga]